MRKKQMWSGETPSKPGWYWVKTKTDTAGYKYKGYAPLEIVHITPIRSSGLLYKKTNYLDGLSIGSIKLSRYIPLEYFDISCLWCPIDSPE